MKRAGCAAIMCAGLWLAPPGPGLGPAFGLAADEPAPVFGATPGPVHGDSDDAPGDAPVDDPGDASGDAQPMRLGEMASRSRAGARESGGAETTSGSVQSVLVLGFVLVLILCGAGFVRWLARRQGGLMASIGPGGRAPAGLIEVLGRYPVARGQTLVLVKLDRRVLLLSQSSGGRAGAGGFTTLSEIAEPDEVASILLKSREESGESVSHRFRSFLAGEEARPWESEPTYALDGPRWDGADGADEIEDDEGGGSAGRAGYPGDAAYTPHAYTGVGLLRERVESLRRSAEGGGR